MKSTIKRLMNIIEFLQFRVERREYLVKRFKFRQQEMEKEYIQRTNNFKQSIVFINKAINDIKSLTKNK